MNEELQTAITQVVNSMMGAAESAYQFGAEQLPDVVEQLILFTKINSLVWAAVFCVATYTFGRLVMSTLKADDEVERAVGPLVFGIAFACTAIAMIYDLTVFLKVTVAPKVWLIEYAAGLVK